MWHLGNVHKVRSTGDITTNSGKKWLVAPVPFIRGEHASKTNHCFCCVRYFNTHKRFARDWSLYTYGVCGKSKLEVVLEANDLREADTFCRLHGIAGDRWTNRYFIHLNRDTKVLEGTSNNVCVCLNVSYARLTFIESENREWGRVVFRIKHRNRKCCLRFSFFAVKHLHYRLAIWGDS